MNEIKNLKEQQINNFIYQMDLQNATASEIKNGLKRILGEEPAVKFLYASEKKLNEKTGAVERTPQTLESVEIFYTFIGDDNTYQAGTCRYIVN